MNHAWEIYQQNCYRHSELESSKSMHVKDVLVDLNKQEFEGEDVN